MIRRKVLNTEIHFCTHKRRAFDQADKCKSKSNSELELGSGLGLKSNITDELLIEILIRLPNSADACRCKSVCKKWRDLISTKYFINRFNDHHNQLNGSPDAFTLLFYIEWWSSTSETPGSWIQHLESPNHPKFKSYNGLGFIPPLGLFNSRHEREYKKTKIKDSETELEPVNVLNSCHDLLLCCRPRSNTYYIVNLLTKHWIVLSPVPPLDQGEHPFFPKCGLLCCYNDYCRFKVILVSTPPESNSSRFTIRIFCSESHEWTQLMVDWYPWTRGADFYTSDMVPHNGMLHWLNGYSLVSLDLFNGDPDVKLSHTINLPDGIVCGQQSILGVCQGHLCVATHRHDVFEGCVMIWKIEDYHKGSWQLLHRFLVPRHLDPNFRLMSFHPYNSDVIIVRRDVFTCQLNVKSGKFDEYVKLKFGYSVFDLIRLETFVLLHQGFPTPLPSPLPLVDVDNTTLFSSP